MTKFEELMDIITRNKNRGKLSADVDNSKQEELEVAGSKSSKTPLLACDDDEMDMDLIDQLYTKPKHRPLDGSGAFVY